MLCLPTLSAQAQAAKSATSQNQLWDGAKAGDTVQLAAALAHGAVIDSLDFRTSQNGRRALNWAAWFNHPDAIRFLVAHGARVNSANVTGFSPLHHAAETGALDAARALLALGADRNARNEAGQRPIDVARERGRFEIVVLLDSLATAR